ncbi:MAG: hypothetical protein A3F18_04380 [Legionellales bacterium RIFCSPHIGHO2_12_FULL_37_14]|nr:MAG: hypothetical protein A3F18_04380 [Legionellales bacterium RIFCSPHIGHO2_12_FULL_37_14]
MKDLLNVFTRQVSRESISILREPHVVLQPLIFFLMILGFFPMILPFSASTQAATGAGLTWIALLLAVLLASERLFQRPFSDGVLLQAFVSGKPMFVIVLATLCTYAFYILLPFLLLSLVTGVLFKFTLEQTLLLIGSLTLGAPGIFALCALAAAFNVGLVQRTTLMALLVLPLTLPIMILGSQVMRLEAMPLAILGIYALLAANSLLCFVGMSFAVVAVLRLRFED